MSELGPLGVEIFIRDISNDLINKQEKLKEKNAKISQIFENYLNPNQKLSDSTIMLGRDYS
jgi:hypothetical protein